MTNEQFGVIVNKFFTFQKKMEETKGKEYANGEDRLGNFKREAIKMGVTPELVCHIYLAKHLDSIDYYVKVVQATGHEPTNQSEPIDGRIGDAIVYLMILYAIIAEREAGTLDEAIRPAL